MPFDAAGARRAGYSDAEIVDYLAGQASFDVRGARRAGYSDAEIITHLSSRSRGLQREEVKKPAYDFAGMTGEAAPKNRGSVTDSLSMSPTGEQPAPRREALSTLDRAAAQQASVNARTQRQSEEIAADGFFSRQGVNLKQSVLSMGSGIARAVSPFLNDSAPGTPARAAANYLDARADAVDEYVSRHVKGETGWQEVKEEDYAPGTIARYIADQGPSAMAQMPLLFSPQGLGIYFTSLTGQIGQERAQANGRDQAEFKDLIAASPAAAASLALDKFGADRVIGTVGRNVLTRTAKAGLAEGITEGVQSAIEYAGGSVGTEEGFDASEAADQALAGAVVGGPMGAAMHGSVEGARATPRIVRLAGDKLTRRPLAPGIRETTASQAAVTISDQSSPIPTDLIAEGKVDVADAAGKNAADDVLRAAGMPETGKRVSITMPDGTVRQGTVRDAFNTDAGELGTAAGIAVDLDDGSIFTEHFDTLADAGVRIQEAFDPTAEADAIDAQLADARADAAVAEEPSPVARRPGFPGFDLTRYMARNRSAESSGNDTAKAATSSAYGRYQFTKGTWLAFYKETFGETGESAAQILAKRADGATQDEVMQTLTAANVAHLQRAGVPVTDGSVYLAHFLGAAEAVNVLKAVPGASVADIVDKRSLAANQAVFAKAPTAGALIDWANGKMGSAPVAADASTTAIPQDSSLGAAPGADTGTSYLEKALSRPDDAAPQFATTDHAETTRAIEAAAANVAEPTEAQKEAGNYRKGHIKLHGLEITIETPKGATRSGTDPDGNAWSVQMPDHYGYVKRTTGADGEQVDVYVGPKTESDRVYVVDQNDADTGKFDEHKAMLGYGSRDEAIAAYHAAFSDGRGPDRVGSVVEMSTANFREWLKQPRPEPAVETAPDARDLVETGTGAAAPAATVEPHSDKSVIVRGLDNSENSRQIVASALPEKGRPLWNAKAGGWVVSKKHEAKLRAVLAAQTDSTGLKSMGSGMADAIGANLRSRLFAKIEAGDTTENGQASPILQAAKRIKDAGGTVDAAMLDRISDGVQRARESGDFQAAMRKLVADLSPNTNTAGPQDGGVAAPVEAPQAGGPEATAADVTVSADGDVTPSQVAREGRTADAAEAKPAASAPSRFAGNKLFTEDKVAAARARLKEKLNRANSGIDPELLMDGIVLAGAHIEAGVRKFADLARALADDIGSDLATLKPYLRAWYNGARDMLEDAGQDVAGMDSPDAVKSALAMIEETATNGASSATGEVEDGADAQPRSLEGDDRAGDGGRDAGGVSAGEGVGGAVPDPDRSSGSGDADLPANGSGRRKQDRSEARPGQPDAGERAGPRRGSRNRPQPGDRVPEGRKPERADRGVNYIAPAGSLKREGGWKTTAIRNLDIVELVNRLDSERRPATPEEQAQLAKFTGWGASEIRNNLFRTVDRKPDGSRVIRPTYYGEWKEPSERAAALLTGDALETALQSTQYAHYTSEAVIRSIWAGVQRLGFNGGKIVEPGMGTGLFAVAGPKAVMEASNYTGIELDGFTAKVASYLLPQETVIPGDYTRQKLPDGFFDLAIGNPPFAQVKVTDDPAYRRHRFSLHDYFFAKTIDKVRPGGLLVFVTSRYTMDKQDAKAREYIAERADLLGAIRLPQTAFKENAGTEVVTDVLFLQRRAPGQEAAGAGWTSLDEIDVKGHKHFVNRYFAEHPEMVLGQHANTGTMYRKNDYTVEPGGKDIEAAFADAVAKLPEGVFIEAAPAAAAAAERRTIEADMRPAADKEGAVYLKDGTLFRREDGVGKALADAEKLSAKDTAWIEDYVPLRDAVKQAQRDQINDGDWEKSLKELNKVYDAFVKKHGQVSAFSATERKVVNDDGQQSTVVYRRFANRKRLEMDVESTLVEALEKIGDDGKISKGPFLLGRTLKKPTRPEVKTAHDAVAVTLDEIGRFDLAYASKLLGKGEDAMIADLGDEIYQHPDGTWIMADEYLSGDVVVKLDEANIAAQADPRFERNVEALTKVMPRPLAHSDIAVKLGAGWIEPHVVEQFAKEVLGDEMSGLTYEPATGSWNVPDSSSRWRRSSTSEWGTEDRSPRELLDAVLNNRTIKVTRTDNIDGKKTTWTDQEATALANERARKIADRFKSWVWTDGPRATRLAEKYNRLFNNLAPRKFDGSHLTFPGLSTRYNLYDHQRRAIWRVIATGNTYLNHAVGAGKTLEMIVAGMEQRRLGLIRKPMYVVPNHMLNQFAREFLDAYPAANIMVADESAFHTNNRRRFMAQAALNDPDAVIVSHSSFGKITTSDETRARVADRFIAELEMVKEELKGGDSRIARSKIEKQIEQLKRRFEGKSGTEGKDKALTFEEMGADFLFVDEAHEFRKLDFATNRTAVKGIDANGSQRALDLYTKLLWLNDQRPGRAAVLSSGTPVTNTMAEIYTVMRYMDQAGLDRDGLGAFDAWASMFGEVVSGFEQNAAGGYEMVERFSKFVNVPEMMKRVRTFMDVLTSDELGELVKRPKVKGGLPENVIAEASDDLKLYMSETLQERIRVSRKWKPSPGEPGNPDPIINIITDGRLSAIDMRFVDPSAGNDPESKLNKMIDRIIEKHREFAGATFTDPATGESFPRPGATQIVFSAVGFGDMVAKSRGFDARAWVNKRLNDAGVPRDAVAWMNDQNTHAKKEATFKAMRNAEKTILLGSPKNMGTGVNVQARLKALHYLSPPWYPSDVEQPHGRIIRQGNMNDEVELYWYATKGTYDSTAWNMVSRKQRFIEQAMRGDDSIRSLEDISEANQYEMASALAAGDERVIELAGLSNEIERLTKLKAAHADEQVSLRFRKEALEREIDRKTGASARLAAAIEARGPVAPFAMQVDGISFTKHGEAGEAMLAKIDAALAAYAGEEDHEVEIARYQGNLPVMAHIDRIDVDGKLRSYFDVAVEAGPVQLDILEQRRSTENVDAAGLSQRIANAANRLEGDKLAAERVIEEAKVELGQAAKKMGAPFEYEAELGEKIAERERLQSDLATETEAAQKATDAKAPKDSIPDSAPVAVLTGNELGDAADMLDMGKRARAWFKENLRLKTVTSSDGAPVTFTRTGEGKLSGGERILRAVPAIRAIVEKGQHFGPFEPTEKWASKGAVAAHRYVANVEVAGETQAYGVLVQEFGDGRRFYYFTDQPEADVPGSRLSLAEGRPEAGARLEITSGEVNLFLVGEDFNRGPGASFEAVRNDLASRLAGMGLSDKVQLRIVGTLAGGAQGRYWPGRSLIEVSLDAKDEASFVLNHEALHAMRDLGVFNGTDWKLLTSAARRTAEIWDSVQRRYAGLTLEQREEEAVADLFALYQRGDFSPQGVVERLIVRIAKFLSAIRNAFHGQGFTSTRTFREVFEDVASGDAAAFAGMGERGRAFQSTDAFFAESQPTNERPEFDNAETEQRFQNARAGVGTTATLRERIAEKLETVWTGMTRHWVALPNEPRFAALQEKLRAIESAPTFARERTVAMLEELVDGFSNADLDLFTRKVILDDLAWDAANERELPFGFTPQTLAAEKAKIDRIVMAQPDRKVWNAAMKRKIANRRIAQELVEVGVLEAEQIKNPAYYRHQVLEYARAQMQMAHGPGKKLRSPKWAKRMGSSLDINANLLEAEFDWLNKAFVDIPVARTIEWIKQSEHNILGDLRKQAKDNNAAGVEAKLEKARETIADPQATDDDVLSAQILIDQEKGFRQRIAMGFDHVRQALRDGEIDVPARFEAVANSIEQGKGSTGDPPFAFLAWMLDNDQPGAMGAAMVLKAIGQRRAWTSQLLGKDYIDSTNADDLVKRLAPEGYRTWQPDEGKLLFTVKTLPEHVLDAMIAKLDAPEGVDPTAFRAALEGARNSLAMGGDRYTMILPEEVAATLSNLRRDQIDSLFENLIREPVRLWKRWVLINPRRFFKYNLNNIGGDLDAVIAGNPRMLRHVGRAGRELAAVALGKAKASERYQEAVARGVFDSGLSVQEIPDIHLLAPFERFAQQKNPITKMALLPLRKAWNTLQGTTQWRENVFRYAAYLDFVERLEGGESQASIGYAASRPAMVDAVTDLKDRAALLARDLLGDYGAISHYGGWLRETVIPFWSWLEINTKRYWRLTSNAYTQGVGKGIATGSGLAAAAGLRTTAYLAVRMALLYGLLSLWNSLFFPDEEDELGDMLQQQMHVILGRNAEGQIVTMRMQGALSDALSWFGFGDMVKAMKEYDLGRGSLSDVVAPIWKTPINKLGTSLSPVITVPVEAATGKKLWPDVFNTRANRDPWRNLFASLSMENEYDIATGNPTRGYGRSWQEAFVYRRDPGEIAYNEARGIAYDWLKREKGQEFAGGFTSKRSEAARKYRTALKYGDESAAAKAFEEMAALGVDRGDFNAMLKRAAPLGPIAKKDRAAFVAQLTEDEYQTFARAQQWYDATFLGR